MPKPPDAPSLGTPWPLWPYELRTSSSQKEGCERLWSIMTKSSEGENGKVKRINAVKVEWRLDKDGLPLSMKEIPGSNFTIEADMVFLSMGFTGPEKNEILKQFNVNYDKQGNVIVDDKNKCGSKLFACGDIVSGASLVVRALLSGQETANNIDNFLNNN